MLNYVLMKRALVLLAVLAPLLSGAGQRRKQPLPPEVEVVQVVARRVENRIELDGTIRNAGEMPAQELVLKFEFLSSGDKVLTVRNGPAPEEYLEPGDECSFYFHLRDEVRAVRFRIRASDRRRDVLKVVKPGPYPIR